MKFEQTIASLEAAAVRYVVAGGFAVNLHGFLRATTDLDILVDLNPVNAAQAMATLSALGLRPRVPVPASDFADPEERRDWFENRNLRVLQLVDPGDPFCSVDVFIRNPIDFDQLWRRSIVVNLGQTPCRLVSLEDLIAMKAEAGRPVDLRDIEELRRVALLQREGKR